MNMRRRVAGRSPRTTKLYDRTKERLTWDEVEDSPISRSILFGYGLQRIARNINRALFPTPKRRQQCLGARSPGHWTELPPHLLFPPCQAFRIHDHPADLGIGVVQAFRIELTNKASASLRQGCSVRD